MTTGSVPAHDSCADHINLSEVRRLTTHPVTPAKLRLEANHTVLPEHYTVSGAGGHRVNRNRQKQLLERTQEVPLSSFVLTCLSSSAVK